MSQGIMEKNLPVAESIQSGDKIRIVTSAGNSKQVDASQIGGGGGALKVTITSEETNDGTLYSTDKTYNQIANADSVMFVEKNPSMEMYRTLLMVSYGINAGEYTVIATVSNLALTLIAESADEVLTYLDIR